MRNLLKAVLLFFTANPIVFITSAAMLLQTAMLVLFWALPDALGLSMRELYQGKELWQLCMALGAILFISSIFAAWQPLHRMLAIVLGIYLAIAAVDYEVLRFSHQRLSYSFLRTYFHISNIFDNTTVSMLGGDPKGTALWLALLLAALGGSIALFIFFPLKNKQTSAKTPLLLCFSGLVLSAIPLILFLSGTRGVKTIPIINTPVDMRFTLGKHTLTAPILHISALEIFERLRDNHKITKENIENLHAFMPPDFPIQNTSTEYPAFHPASFGEYKAKIPYNIILVFGESYKGRIFNQMLSGDTSLAPNLWKLATSSEGGGLWFKNAYSGGYPTVRGTTSTYLGFPSHPNRDVPSFYASNHFTGFPELLANYAKTYMTVSNPIFDHTLPFVEKFFDKWQTIGKAEIEGTSDSLGMDLTLNLLNDLSTDKPYLLVYNTASTHIPFYNYPNDFAPKPDDAMSRYRNALRYTDNQFGRLLAALAARPDYHRTAIIVLGDHDTPVDSIDYAYPQPIGVSAARIFLGIFSPDTNLFKGLEIREDVASQLDIAPTILDLAQVKSANHFWGYDLLTQERPAEQPALFYSQNAYFLGFRDFALTGDLASEEVYIGKNGFSPASDSLSLAWRKRAIETSKILRSLLRDDKMQPKDNL